jgi:hypothetical protein
MPPLGISTATAIINESRWLGAGALKSARALKALRADASAPAVMVALKDGAERGQT